MPAYSEIQDTQQTPTALFFCFFLFLVFFLHFFCGSLAFLVLISLLLVLPVVVNATIKKTISFYSCQIFKEKTISLEKSLYMCSAFNKEADCLKFEDESTNTFFLFWATAVDLKKTKTFLCSTIPHVCRMLSRKVDKVSKDVERTRDPRGLQVGETPPDDSGVPQPQSSLGIHVTCEV